MIRSGGLILWTVLAVVCAAPAEHPFSAEPSSQPYYVRDKEAGPVLNCAFSENYRNRDRYEPEWTMVVSGTPKILTRNNVVFLKNDYTLHEDANTGEYSLQIKYINFERDNGQFFCRLLDRETGEQILSTPAIVMVVVPPSQPTITVQPSQAVKENEFVTIHCESSGGNPPPKFSWIFNNHTVVPTDGYQDKSEPGLRATSVSVLQWRVGANDNGAYLTCQIWNEAMQKGEFRTVETNRLNVLYAPRVKVGPAASYNVEEGEPVELTCQAEGNPPPAQFEWLHVATGEHMVGKQWKFIADKKMRGDFRCTAVNSIDVGAAKLSMDVFYAPKVKVPSVSHPAEGDQLELECEVDANPPPEQIMWNGPNGFTHLGARLVIDSIQRGHTGNFTCQADNAFELFSMGGSTVRRTGSASTLVDVKRRPGSAVVTANRSSINVGEILSLSCLAKDPGSPEAKFRWATPASHGLYSVEPEFNRQTITINRASLTENGMYRCVAYNEIGQGEEAAIRIIVIEPASISRPLLPNRILTSGDVDSAIDCEAVGYPQPSIRWLKDGLPVREAVNPHWVIQSHPSQQSCSSGEYCPWTVVSSFRFFGAVEWSDKGNYTCIAENGAVGVAPAQNSTVMNVVHEPVVLNKLYPTEGLAAANVGTSARISCLVSARPEPKFVWMRNGAEIEEADDRFMVHSSKLYSRLDEYESVLEVTDVTEADLGAYVCKAVNGHDNGKTAEVVINLQPNSKPQMPQSVQLYDVATTWMVVAWQPGFDGGDHQLFEIEYRAGNPRSDSNEMGSPTTFVLDEHNATIVVSYENVEKNERPRRSVLPAEFFSHNLTMLNPMSLYWYRIRARNAYGYSDWSAITDAVTQDVSESLEIAAPTSLVYYANEHKITFEPTNSTIDSCLLLYINGKDNDETVTGSWRTLGCYPNDQPILNVEPAEHFKARFCQRNDLSVCSSSVEILVASSVMDTQWSTIVIPVAVIVILLVLAILLFVLCCRTNLFCSRRQQKAKTFTTVTGDAERAAVSGPLPQSDTKNTIIHGSQTDSGVFTLGSLPNSQPNNNNPASSFENGFNNESENGADSWHNSTDEQFNYNNDPYLQDYSGQFMATGDLPAGNHASYQPFYEGYLPPKPDTLVPHSSDDQTDEGSDTASCSANGSRRVMREIIV